MEDKKKEINVLVLAWNNEVTIASTIFKVQNDIGPARVSVTVFDNGSTDDTSIISNMAGAQVVRYNTRHGRSVIFKRAVLEAQRTGSRITIILDLLGENTAEDAVMLAEEALAKGEEFQVEYVRPGKGNETVGCIALDRESVDMLARREEDVRDIFLEMAKSRGIVSERFIGSMETVARMRKEEKRIRNRPLIRLWKMVNNNPLKFYGGSGMIIFLVAMANGFYTINYFYIHQNLYYPTAFITVLLVMISGFLMVAGVMLNAMKIMVERVRALKTWERSTPPEKK
ncbi:MAG: hypothetical protein JXA22_09000 [Candidatus Thermoplasmatota archaeon]|nr:hypothetical protein [Candidatus Thermoplasmatota archaeon]